MVWDTYLEDSLKESAREKRGKGLRRKVSSHAKLPGNWMDFLRDSSNKTELFSFLTSKVVQFNFPPEKAAHITFGESVISLNLCSAASLTVTTKRQTLEEADTRRGRH